MDRETLTALVLDLIGSLAVARAEGLRLDTPLGAEGLGIDSIGCLELVLELEQRTGITLRDENLSAETLATPGSLIEHLLASQRR